MAVILNAIFIFVAILFIAGAGFIPFALLWWLGIVLAKPTSQRRRIARVAALPVYALGFATVLTAFFFWSFRPAAIFESHLGFPPPDSVRDLRSTQFILGDQGSARLHFIADPAVVQRILNQKPWRETSRLPAVSKNDPRGSRPLLTEIKRYEQRLTAPTFASETATLNWHPATGRVWYEWSGIE